MTARCTLRTAQAGDRAAIQAIYRPAMKDLISEIWGWDEVWQQADFSAHFMPEGITLACLGQTLAGYSQVEDRDGRLFIRMIAVHPQHQHCGIGGVLLESVIASADRLSRPVSLEVFRINAFARAFYERHGFVVEAATPHGLVMCRP